MRAAALGWIRNYRSGLVAIGLSTVALINGPAGAADPCSKAQGDAEYLRQMIQVTLTQLDSALVFQRNETAQTAEFQSRCGGREDASPQCRSIAIGIDALRSLRVEHQQVAQQRTQALTYYRQQYDAANLALFNCRDLQGTPSPPDPDAPPYDPDQARREDADRDAVYKVPVADLPPYDPNVDLSPPNAIGDPGVHGPSRRSRIGVDPIGPRLIDGSVALRGPSRRSRIGQEPIDRPTGDGTSSDPPPPATDATPAPATPSSQNLALIGDTCGWASQQTDPDDLWAREQILRRIQGDAESGDTDKARRDTLRAAQNQVAAEQATLSLFQSKKGLDGLVALQQTRVDQAKQAVDLAIDELADASSVKQQIGPALDCLQKRKTDLAAGPADQTAANSDPNAQSSDAPGTTNTGGGGQGGQPPAGPPDDRSKTAQPPNNGPATPPNRAEPPNNPPKSPPRIAAVPPTTPPTPPANPPPAKGTAGTPPAPPKSTGDKPAASQPNSSDCPGGGTRYTCHYQQPTVVGNYILEMDVCVPPGGNWASARCTIDSTRIDQYMRTGQIKRTTCDPTKDAASFASQCKSFPLSRLDPPSTGPHADVAPSTETAVAPPDKADKPSVEVAVAPPPDKPQPPSTETAVAPPEQPKLYDPTPKLKPVPAPVPGVSTAEPAPLPATPAPDPHVKVVTLPPPPDHPPQPETPHQPYVNPATPAPAPSPAPAQPHVNIYEKPAMPANPPPSPTPGGSAGISSGTCTNGVCTRDPPSSQPPIALKPLPPTQVTTAPKVEPVAPMPQPAPKPLPPVQIAPAPKIDQVTPAQKPAPKPLPPTQVAAAPKVEPATPAQNPAPKALPPTQVATTPKVEPKNPAQKPAPTPLPPTQVAAMPKVEPVTAAEKPLPAPALPPPSVSQAKVAPKEHEPKVASAPSDDPPPAPKLHEPKVLPAPPPPRRAARQRARPGGGWQAGPSDDGEAAAAAAAIGIIGGALLQGVMGGGGGGGGGGHGGHVR